MNIGSLNKCLNIEILQILIRHSLEKKPQNDIYKGNEKNNLLVWPCSRFRWNRPLVFLFPFPLVVGRGRWWQCTWLVFSSNIRNFIRNAVICLYAASPQPFGRWAIKTIRRNVSLLGMKTLCPVSFVIIAITWFRERPPKWKFSFLERNSKNARRMRSRVRWRFVSYFLRPITRIILPEINNVQRRLIIIRWSFTYYYRGFQSTLRLELLSMQFQVYRLLKRVCKIQTHPKATSS